MRTGLTVMIGTVALLAGCLQRPLADEVGSKAKWGHLDDYTPISLFNTAPGETIQICSDEPGTDGKLVEFAVRDWFRAIGRVEQVTFRLSCADKEKSQALVNAILHPGGEYLKHCQKSDDVIGFADAHRDGRYGGTIVRCKPNVSVDQMLAHTLHEVGHLVGMCDGYAVDNEGKLTRPIGMHKSCSEKHRSANSEASVMNAGFDRVAQLTPHDAEGAVEFANRDDLKVTGKWPPAQLPDIFSR